MQTVPDSPLRADYSAARIAVSQAAIDEAYQFGHDLGEQGIPAMPSLHYSPAEVNAFEMGHDDGYQLWTASLCGPDAWPDWTDRPIPFRLASEPERRRRA